MRSDHAPPSSSYLAASRFSFASFVRRRSRLRNTVDSSLPREASCSYRRAQGGVVIVRLSSAMEGDCPAKGDIYGRPHAVRQTEAKGLESND